MKDSLSSRGPKGRGISFRLAGTILLALLGVTRGQAADWQAPQTLRETAELLAREQVAVPGQSVIVKASLDDRLRVPACGREPKGRAVGTTGTTVTVELACSGPSSWTIYVTVQVSRQAEVLVLNRAMRAGETVGSSDISVRTREVAGLTQATLTDVSLAVGRTARRALAAGAVVAPDDLQSPRLVRRGQPLTLVGRVGRLVVRADGKALADGGSGDTILVENLNSKRIVRGRVRTDQEADVDL